VFLKLGINIHCMANANQRFRYDKPGLFMVSVIDVEPTNLILDFIVTGCRSCDAHPAHNIWTIWPLTMYARASFFYGSLGKNGVLVTSISTRLLTSNLVAMYSTSLSVLNK
jgi:hypothetical protein